MSARRLQATRSILILNIVSTAKSDMIFSSLIVGMNLNNGYVEGVTYATFGVTGDG